MVQRLGLSSVLDDVMNDLKFWDYGLFPSFDDVLNVLRFMDYGLFPSLRML